MRRAGIWTACVCSLLFVVVSSCHGDDAVPSEAPLRWWKGNLHTHSLWSDGNDFPEMIAEWYRTRDYNFLALTDHNVLSEGIRWMDHATIVKRGGKDALAKYRSRFGDHWVRTLGREGTPGFKVQLKPLNEFRSLVEQRGQFIMLSGEEISDRSQGVPVHMNATNIKQVIAPVGGATVAETIANNLRAVDDQASRVGREILFHVNHPNFGYAVTAEDLASVIAGRFFEVYNGHPGVNQLGDKGHVSIERMWDVINTIRLGELHAAPIYGLATDDSHYYHGRPGSRPGRGWLMVRARRLTPETLIRAINSGDFYASSGVTLSKLAFDAESRRLDLEIAADSNVEYTTRFVGTMNDYDRTSRPALDGNGTEIRATRRYSADVGRVLATVKGPRASYEFSGHEIYVRAVVTSSRRHPDPSVKDQHEQAWTQPVGWDDRVGPAK